MQVWISNHGGRQLDSTHGTFTVLPRIAQAIRCLSQDVTIIVDGGVCRGGDRAETLSGGRRKLARHGAQGV